MNKKDVFSDYQNKIFVELNEPYYIKTEYLYERFLECLPPEESYLFFPKGEEIMIPHKKPEKALRRIYYNTPYTNLEKKWIKDYEEIINNNPNNILPDYWNTPLNLMFIYSENCNLQKAYNRMIEYIKWYKKFFPLTFTPKDKAIDILNSGFCYCYGRDHEYRPIIICQPYILQKRIKEYSADDLLRASVFLCEFIKNNMLIPGQVENWNMIVNLKDTSLLSIPDPIKKVITALSDNFIAKLYRSYIINMSFILRVLYKLMCSLLEEITVRKIVVIDGKEDKRMFNFINPLNLEKRFGGDADDLQYDGENSLFPPKMPEQQKFLLDNENKNNILISEEEYIKIMNTLPEESLSPYILKHIQINEEKKRLEKIQKDNEIRIKKEEEDKKIFVEKLNEFNERFFSDENWSFNSENIKINNNNNKNENNVVKIKSQSSKLLQDLYDFNKRKKNMFWSIKET